MEKDKVKWQKAQLYDHPTLPPCMRGRQVWVKIGPPREVTGITWLSRTPATIKGYEVNIDPEPGSIDFYIAYEVVQDLLPEFAEDVEMIPYEVWNKG